MKPYGLPSPAEYPDVVDIQSEGRKTSVGGKDYFRNKDVKRATRRLFKKGERMRAKNEIAEWQEDGTIDILASWEDQDPKPEVAQTFEDDFMLLSGLDDEEAP